MTPFIIVLLILAVVGATLGIDRFFRRRNSPGPLLPTAPAPADARTLALEKENAFLVDSNLALRTPLTLIYAPLKSMLARAARGETVDFGRELQAVCRQAEHMEHILNTAMEVHTSGSHSLEADADSHNMVQAILATLKRHNTEIRSRGLNIDIDAPDNLPGLNHTAPERLRTILDKLMQHAMRRSAQGTSIKISVQMAGPGAVRVSFADSGTVASGHLSPNHLGLSYTRSMAESLGGRMGARSNAPEPGLSVWVELPLDAVSGTSGTPRALASVAEAEFSDVDTSAMTALVAEADSELCTFLASQLRFHFKHVYTASAGDEALQHARHHRPDIVLSSFSLAAMSGTELCMEIKVDPATRHIPVVVLTDLPTGSQPEMALSAGADSYIAKPFDITALMMRIHTLLHNRPTEVEAVSATDDQPVLDADDEFIRKIDSLISANLADPEFNVDAIARSMGMSRTVLYSKFKTLTGNTIAAYINDYRLNRAYALLRAPSLTISEISERLGFRAQRHFSTFFKDRTGQTPSAFRSSSRTV